MGRPAWFKSMVSRASLPGNRVPEKVKHPNKWMDDNEELFDAEKARGSFVYFCNFIYVEECRNPFDKAFHGILMMMVEHGEVREIPSGDYYFRDRKTLIEASKVGFFTEKYLLHKLTIGKHTDLPEVTVKDRLRKEPTNLDGSWRGVFVRITPSALCDLRLYMLPRGHLKTTLLTIARKLWQIIRRPDEEHLIAMQSGVNSKNLLSEMKGHFERNARFRKTFPELIPRNLQSNETSRGRTRDGLRWQANSFDVPIPGSDRPRREPAVVGAGINSRVVSTHFRNIDYDDIVDDKNSRTKEGMETVIRQMLAFESLGVGDITKKTYVGTPWHDADCSQFILDADDSGYHWMTCLIATCEDKAGNPMYPKTDQRWHPGFTRDRLQRLRNRQKSLFNALYLMQPVGADSKAFDPKWWRFYKKMPGDGEYTTVITVDPAISTRVQGDWTAMVVTSIDRFGNWWIREILREQGLGVPGIIDAMYRLARRWQPDMIGVEGVGFQATIIQVLEDQWRNGQRSPLPVTKVTPASNASKEWRIGRIMNRVSSGLVHLPAPLPDEPLEMRWQRPALDEGFDALILEGERFPMGSTDDVIDALSMTMDVNLNPHHQSGSKTPDRGVAHSASRGLYRGRNTPEDAEAGYDAVLGSCY